MPYKMLEEWKRPGNIAKAIFFIGIMGIIAIPAWQANNARVHPLNWYQSQWCQSENGQAQAKMPDKTSCACLTSSHAVEFAYADTWYEAVGLALYNAKQSQKKAGLALIMEEKSDEKYLQRLNQTVSHFKLPINIWPVKIESFQK